MKPAAQVLLAAGVALVLGAGAFFGFVAPLREERYKSGNQHTVLRTNLWGQPLWGIIINSDSTGWAISESGPFQRAQRNGRWSRSESKDRNTWAHNDVWYLDGKEVTEEEWKQKQ